MAEQVHMQIFATVVSLAITLVAIALFAKAAGRIVSVVRLGQPVLGRTDDPGSAGSPCCARRSAHPDAAVSWGGAAHWFVFIGFGFLFITLVTAYGRLFDPGFAIPLIGHWYPWSGSPS